MNQARSASRWPAVILVTVSIAIAGGGFCIHGIKGQQMRREAEAAIVATAEAKAAYLAHWRKEQLDYGSLLTESPFLTDALARYLADPQPSEKDRLLVRFRSIKARSGYDDVLLLDARGKVRLALGDSIRTLHHDAEQGLAVAFRDRRPTLTDLHAGPGGLGSHVDLIAPFFSEAPEPAGAILLRFETRTFLDPVLASWPRPSRSAETVLVRRDGDSVLFLTSLRHQPGADLNLRVPLSEDGVPAVMAVKGREGLVYSRDYRSVPVLAAIKAVPESPWYVVAKENESETLAAWRSMSKAILVLTVSLAAAALGLVGFFWQRSRKAHYRALAQEERDKREAEAKYRLLFESSQDALMTLAPPSWKFTSANRAALDLFAVPDEAGFTALGPWELSPERQPDGMPSGEKAQQMIATAMREGASFFEWTHKQLDGVEFPCTVLLTRMTIGGNAFLQATVRDISVQKQVENELKLANIVLSVQQETSLDGILIVDGQGGIVSFNRQFRDMWGIPPEVLASGSDEAALNCVLDKLVEPQQFLDKVKFLYEHRHDTSRDEIDLKGGRTFDRYSAPMLGADAKYYGRVWYFRDITERKRAEEERLAARTFLDSVINAIADPVFVKDDRRRFVLVNDALCAMVGRPREALLGEDGNDMFPVDQVEVFVKMDVGVLDTGTENVNEESLSNLSSGEVRTIVTRKTRYIDPAGKRFLVGVIRDITERKQMEHQLRRSQKLEAIGQLAGGVAHEFNNLLMGIGGYAQLLQGRFGADAEAAQDLGRIRELSQRGAGLSRQLLTFSRRSGSEPVTLDINSAIEKSHEMLQRLLPENITQERHLGRGLWMVHADPGQLEQVLVNLVINARDAMPNGGRLLIETANAELDAAYAQTHLDVRPGRHVMLSVTDTGVGMDEATQRRLFEPFFTTKEIGKGTGLGLATIHGIVKQHGGHINVYSEPGQGSTFKVFLPRVDAPERAAAETEAPAPAAPAAPATPNSLASILLVEDEAQVREVVQRFLEGMGYRVLSAPGPAEAEEAFRQHGQGVDLLITDLSMPGMSGAELHRRLSAGRSRLRAIFMSAHPETMIRHNYELEAGLPFIQKPFVLVELASRVRQELASAGGGTERAP